MAACWFRNGILLALTPFVVTASSFLRQVQKHQSVGDWDTSVRVCTFGTKPGHDNLIKVFADEADNTRYVSFAREGFASDDGFIESMQKCKGDLPSSCKQRNVSTGCAACPCELDLDHEPFGNYQRRMLEIVVPQCQSHKGKDPFRVLIVGLGGGALVQYILGKCPQGTVVEAAEYDPRMLDVATRFFGLQPPSGVFQVEHGDGGAIVAAHATKGHTFDMVLVDAFAGGSHVPESCRNEAFVGNTRRILRKSGFVIHNMAGPTVQNLAGSDDYKTTFPLYQKSFGSKAVKLERLTGGMEFPANIIVAQVPS